MSIRFVSTAILSSSDGIDFDTEEKLETVEAKEARKAAERGASKPLFQQLAEREEAKKLEYDLNTKRMNAPPKALDDEDVNHLNSLAEKEITSKQARKEEEDKELEAFRASRSKVSHPIDQLAPLEVPKSAEQAIIIPLKRKAEPEARMPVVGNFIPSSITTITRHGFLTMLYIFSIKTEADENRNCFLFFFK